MVLESTNLAPLSIGVIIKQVIMFIITRSVFCIALIFSLSGCVGTIVNTAVDTTIAVAKVPFKVAGAAIDVATGDDDKGSDEKSEDE